jgi:hypothetical protein
MLGFVKMCGVSAVLSFTLVTGYQLTEAGAPIGSSKLYHQRLGEASTSPARTVAALGTVETASGTKGDRLTPGAPADCARRTWPYLGADCVAAVEGTKKRAHVRFITVESREGVNVSVLQRVPQTDIALR